tara:strand:+ start:280 stop:573 length:294 start_codon:yes stop_codon:yes gene_type:complete
MKFRKKPVEIYALQLTDENIFEVTKFIDGKAPDIKSDMASDKWDDYIQMTKKRGHLYIHSLEGRMTASFGDYIIKGVKGEFYPCKPDIFKLTYDEVN